METIKRTWSGRGFVGKLPIGYGALTILMCVITVFASDTAQAQEPEPEHVVYLPIIHFSPPWPYNVKAADLVLQPSDMPSGYELDEEESGPIEFSDEVREMGAVDGYENEYSDSGQLFSGTPVVINPVVVFGTPQGVQSHIQYVKQIVQEDSDFKSFRSVPTIGDETVAFEMENDEGFFPMTGYYIIFRKGNLESWIATGGITGIVQFDDAIWFARKSLKRINSRLSVSAVGPNIEPVLFSEAKEGIVKPSLATGSLKCDNLTKAILQTETDILSHVFGGWDVE